MQISGTNCLIFSCTTCKQLNRENKALKLQLEIASQTQKECRCFTLAVHSRDVHIVNIVNMIQWYTCRTVVTFPDVRLTHCDMNIRQPGDPQKTWHPWCGSNHSRRSFSENTIWRTSCNHNIQKSSRNHPFYYISIISMYYEMDWNGIL